MRTICTLSPLPSGTHLVADGEVLVHVSESGEILAAPNRCQHAGARLGEPSGCVSICGFHGWRLDASKMRYLAPHANVEQPRYVVQTEPEMWTILDSDPVSPWTERQPRRELIPGSFSVTFFEDRVLIRAAGQELSWPIGSTPRTGPVAVWRSVGAEGRSMWLGAGEGAALLVEVAGHRLLLASSSLEPAPSGLDLLVVVGDSAEELARCTAPSAVASDRPSVIRSALVGIPVWTIQNGLRLDVTTGRRVDRT